MGFPPSTLSAGLVPTQPLKEMKRTAGKYVSTLGPDLLPPPKQTTQPVKAEALTPAWAHPEPSKLQQEPAAPVMPDYFRHLREFETIGRPHPPLGGGFGGEHCIYTGDRFNNVDNVEGAVRSVVSQEVLPAPAAPGPRVYKAHRGDKANQADYRVNRSVYLPGDRTVTASQPTCIFTGDDMPSSSAAAEVPPKPPPETPAELWEMARGGDDRKEWRAAPSGAVASASLQRLREWKSRCVMPETIGGVGGFGSTDGARGAAARDAEAVRLWTNERQFREWEDQTGKAEGRLFRERSENLIANQPVSEYGERRPARGRGDVFSPFAPRQF